MAVTAKMVKELRDKTGAGMMDCKKALVECEGSIEKAIDWLREKGISKAQKKVNRIAAEGLCNIVIDKNDAIIYEINSETDFVAKNEQFLDLVDKLGSILVKAKPNTIDEALNFEFEGKALKDYVMEASGKIGEKLTFRRVETITKTDTQVFGSYKHMGGKIAVITLLEGNNEEVSKDIAMHVAAMNPKYVNEDAVNPSDLEHERKMFTKEFENELEKETNEKAKAAKTKRIPQIVEGKIKKWLKESCLVNQQFVKNPDVTVLQYAKDNNSEIINFIRFEVGEGIEKRQDNFAEEVMAQVRA